MPIILPKQKQKPESVNPEILMIYGTPKVGKTKVLSELEDNLIIDMERGTLRYDAMSLQVSSYEQMQEVLVELNKAYIANNKQPVYKYITYDTLDILEDISKHKAAEMFKETPMGRKWYTENYSAPGKLKSGGEDITSLPNGAGYGYIREAMKWYIATAKRFCKYLIVVTHIKDKRLPALNGIDEVIVKDISLTGKLGAILGAQADAIGYMYRTMDNKLMISFKTNESAVMGSRCEHLAGKIFEFNWENIYVQE